MSALAIAHDPHDAWPLQLSYDGRLQRIYPARAVQCFEGFEVSQVTPTLARFLPFVRTDYHRWQHDLEWTLESGPDDAPSSVDIIVPYNFSGGCGDYFAGGCWNPGDPSEVETGTAMYFNDHGEWCEVNLTDVERERVELYIYENPPEPDYGDD